MVENKFTVTESFVEEFKTKRGSWTRRQLELIGINWPPKNGWKKRVIGNEISIEAAMEFKQISIDSTGRPKDSKSIIFDLEKRIVNLELEVTQLREAIEFISVKIKY